MRYPSFKTIQTRLDIPPELAKLIRRLIDGTQDAEEWLQSKDKDVPLRGSHSELALHTIDVALNEYHPTFSFGVESARDDEWDNGYFCDIGFEYINRGDTYIPTIIYDNRLDRWIVSSWGDHVESQERQGRTFP